MENDSVHWEHLKTFSIYEFLNVAAGHTTVQTTLYTVNNTRVSHKCELLKVAAGHMTEDFVHMEHM
jgi:hypothetical protein